MPHYTPPLRDMQFVLHEVLKVADELKAMPRARRHRRADRSTRCSRRAASSPPRCFPLNQSGDDEGCKLDKATHEVTHAQGLQGGLRAVRRRRLAGAVGCDPEFGGQGLPIVVNQCLYEMLNSANQAWTMYPGPVARRLRGAARARHRRAEGDLPAQADQRRVDRHHVPDRSRTAAPTSACCAPRPSRRPTAATSITGHKIFISAGEHDMAENIVHLVLARLPDAPPGSKGISLFVVPKFLRQGRRLARRAQRDLLPRPRAQDGHPRQRHRADRSSTAPPARWSASPTRACRRCS